MATPPVPTGLAPASSSVQGTSNFPMQATVGAHANPQRVEFQIATNSGFSGATSRFTAYVGGPGTVSAYAENSPRWPQTAGNGIWLRARAVEQTSGDASAWTSSTNFRISHPPTVVGIANSYGVYPWTGVGTGAANIPLLWRFLDVNETDVQSKYQLQVTLQRDAGGNAITPETITGSEVTSATESGTITIPYNRLGYGGVWRVKVWDNEGLVASAWSPDLLFDTDANLASISSLTIGGVGEGGTITTRLPSVAYTLSHATDTTPEGGGYHVMIFEGIYEYGQINIFNTEGLVYDSTLGVPILLFYPLPHEGPDATHALFNLNAAYMRGVGLKNNSDYTMAVLSFPNAYATTFTTAWITFHTSWAAPATPGSLTIFPNYLGSKGYNVLAWTSVQSVNHHHWNIYRKDSADTPWRRLAAVSWPTATFLDYSCPAGQEVTYALSETASTSIGASEQVESDWQEVTVDVSPYATYDGTYTLYPVDRYDLQLVLPSVTEESFDDEYEQTTHNVLNRGRRVEIGTRWGRKGSMSVQFRDYGTPGYAEAQLNKLLAIKEARVPCGFKRPWDTQLISIDSVKVQYIAGTVSGLTDVSIEYSELVNLTDILT
jgi:hypothetical protein